MGNNINIFIPGNNFYKKAKNPETIQLSPATLLLILINKTVYQENVTKCQTISQPVYKLI